MCLSVVKNPELIMATLWHESLNVGLPFPKLKVWVHYKPIGSSPALLSSIVLENCTDVFVIKNTTYLLHGPSLNYKVEVVRMSSELAKPWKIPERAKRPKKTHSSIWSQPQVLQHRLRKKISGKSHFTRFSNHPHARLFCTRTREENQMQNTPK